MSKKGRKRVKNGISPRRNVISSEPTRQEKIYIDLTKYKKWTDSVKIGNFTNHLENKEEAVRHFLYILKIILAYIEENGNDILANNVKHCHVLRGKQDLLARKIIKKMYGNKVLLDDDTNLWELGAPTEEIRIIGSFVVKVFYPLFIDHHHLIYPNKNYNNKDYGHFSYSAQNIINSSL